MTEQLASEAAAWQAIQQAIQQAAAASRAFVAKWHSECQRLGYDPDSVMGKAVAISLREESDKINAMDETKSEGEVNGLLDGLSEWVEFRLKAGQKKLANTIMGGVTSISALDDLELLGSSSREYPSAKYQDRVRHINDKLKSDAKPWKFVAVDNEAKIIEFDWNTESSVTTR